MVLEIIAWTQFVGVIEDLQKQGVDMTYALYRYDFLTKRINDPYYPLPLEMAIQSQECAITYTVSMERKKDPELNVELPENFCRLKDKNGKYINDPR